MKTRVLVTVGCCLLGLVGCSTLKVPFQGSPLVPAAQATAKVERDQNENALVDLVLEHLAPAEKLWPPKALYMVWVEESEGRLLPLGRLLVNEDRQGRFRGTTPFENFRIIISAENEPNPERPSLPYVLATEFMTP